MAKSKLFYIRKTHRYLGIILGIQFLMWTISGIYFSWSDLDEIRGDLHRKTPARLQGNFKLISPGEIFNSSALKPDSIHDIHLVNILGKPFYSLQFFTGNELKKVLADATNGIIRPAISKEEAISIAAESFIAEPTVKSIHYISEADAYHEYREKPLPAWVITFNHPSNTNVYVSAELGKVESFRNDKWRIFDFLWMGHIMGYQDRDDTNNMLLRIFSLFGLFTVLSGFILFFASRKKTKKNIPPVAA